MLPTIKSIADLWKNDKYTFIFLSLVAIAAIIWAGYCRGWWGNEALAAWVQAFGSIFAIAFAAKQARDTFAESDRRHAAQRLDQERENYARIKHLARMGTIEMNRLNLTLSEDRSTSANGIKIANEYFLFVREQLSGVSIFDIPPHQISNLVALREISDFCIRKIKIHQSDLGLQIYNFEPSDINSVIERLALIEHNVDIASDFCDPVFDQP